MVEAEEGIMPISPLAKPSRNALVRRLLQLSPLESGSPQPLQASTGYRGRLCFRWPRLAAPRAFFCNSQSQSSPNWVGGLWEFSELLVIFSFSYASKSFISLRCPSSFSILEPRSSTIYIALTRVFSQSSWSRAYFSLKCFSFMAFMLSYFYPHEQTQ
jgi:hypothetical protein